MSEELPSAVIIVLITWTGIICFTFPFIFCCCRTYYREHPNSKFTRYFLFPMINTEKCLQKTYKRCNKHDEENIVHVNQNAIVGNQEQTSQSPAATSPVSNTDTSDTPLSIPPRYSDVEIGDMDVERGVTSEEGNEIYVNKGEVDVEMGNTDKDKGETLERGEIDVEKRKTSIKNGEIDVERGETEKSVELACIGIEKGKIGVERDEIDTESANTREMAVERRETGVDKEEPPQYREPTVDICIEKGLEPIQECPEI